MRVTKKAYAKVNLALNVFDKTNSGYHQLDSLVVTVDLFDKVTLISRRDKKVNLKVAGFTGYANTFIKEVGIGNVTLYINSIGCKECRKKYQEALKEYFYKNIDGMCPL